MNETSKTRFKIIFPSTEAFHAGTAVELPDKAVQVTNKQRRFVVLESTPEGDANMVHQAALNFQNKFNAEIFEDYQYEIDSDSFSFDVEATTAAASLDDVVKRVKATDVWKKGYKGQGVAIAVVDTGIDGRRPEFPTRKRLGGWAVPMQNPWTDWKGHGTMCACIAAGTTVMAVRSTESLLTQISSHAEPISGIPSLRIYTTT